MRAKDYISFNRSKLKYTDILLDTLDRFADFRADLSKTTRQFNTHLSKSEKWVKFVQKCNKKSFPITKHWDFLQELQKCVASDGSYAYLYSCLISHKEQALPTADLIQERIAAQFEDYPHKIIDEYLTNDINRSFAESLDTKDYTEKQEIDIFNAAYVLFDEIRQQLLTPRHATHRYKEFKCENDLIKDEVLRLLSFYIKNYNYDITEEQRQSLDDISNSLGRYIQGRINVRNEANGNRKRWEELKCTIENMASDSDKKALLITEKTSFLQLSKERQEATDPDFAQKCQLEIEKIDDLAALRTASLEAPHAESVITLDYEAISKIDFYRIMNVLCEMKCFKRQDGKKLFKKTVFEELGHLLNQDFSKFQDALASAKASSNKDMASEFKIFDTLRTKQETIMNCNSEKTS